jgi:hypothetical protein
VGFVGYDFIGFRPVVQYTRNLNISWGNKFTHANPHWHRKGWPCIEKKPEKGREAAAPSNIKEIQEIQGGQEAPHDGDAINPKDT